MASFEAGDLMSRSVFVVPFLALALQVSQAQTFSRGIPASVVSPTADGRQHGIPASVVSPTPLPVGVHPQRSIRIRGPLRRFGNPRSHRQVFLPIPVFYPFYNDESYPSTADPYVPDSSSADPASAQQQQAAGERSDDELRAAYLQGARDAMSQQADSRYGEHYMDSRERGRQRPQEERKSEKRSQPSEDNDPPTPVAVEDKTPAAVFIFKDGHQLETKNYAIMNGTLFDFSSKTLKKIQMDEIDSAATLKANDDRGVVMKLN
jgi:hypothetical protein